jgi:hypothetical protein
MFAVLHSDINSLKSSLLHLTGQPYWKKSRSAKVKDGIINLFLRNNLIDRYSAHKIIQNFIHFFLKVKHKDIKIKIQHFLHQVLEFIILTEGLLLFIYLITFCYIIVVVHSPQDISCKILHSYLSIHNITC